MAPAHKKLHCGTCGRIFYNGVEGGKTPRHQKLDPSTFEKTGEWCDGAGQPLKVHVVPAAQPSPCLVCRGPIALGEKVHMVKGPTTVMDFGSGHVTYMVEPGAPVVGGIHLACVKKESAE